LGRLGPRTAWSAVAEAQTLPALGLADADADQAVDLVDEIRVAADAGADTGWMSRTFDGQAPCRERCKSGRRSRLVLLVNDAGKALGLG
jgi:hypothetical protein